MYVNRKMRRDCSGNPSKLEWRSSRDWRTVKPHDQVKSGPSLSTWRRQRGWLWRVCERDPGHLVPCPIPLGALVGGLGRGSGVTMGTFLPSVRHCT